MSEVSNIVVNGYGNSKDEEDSFIDIRSVLQDMNFSCTDINFKVNVNGEFEMPTSGETNENTEQVIVSEPMEVLPENVEKAIASILKKRGIYEYCLRLEPASQIGENSYGSVTRIEVSPSHGVGEVNGNRIPEQIHFIAKMSPKNPARRLQMKVVEYYVREVLMYEHVLRGYLQLQIEYGIPSCLAFTGIPEMYHCSLEDINEFIIFDDLRKSGYSMFDRRSSISYEHIKLALKEIAKFHAMSFATKEKKPELFESFVSKVREDNLFTESLENISVDFAKKYIDKTVAAIKELRLPNRSSILRKLEKARENFKALGIEMVDGDAASPYAVICHGDFWNNNVMFKYDKSGTPISAKLIDFQMSRYASPVLDFLHYVFTGTEKELRDLHFQDMKKVYHESLAAHLRLFDCDPQVIYPYTKFEEHLKDYGVYGFLISVYAIPFIISDGSDLPNLDEVSEALRSPQGSSDSLDSGSLNGVNGNLSDDNAEDPSKDKYPEASADTASTETNSETSSEVDEAQRNALLLENFDFLTDHTNPIFKRRMTGIVIDLDRHGMFNV